MKTLDEVIKAKELCNDHKFRCHECSYYDDDNEVGCRSDDLDADALHYLKEYRETKEHLACMDKGEIRGDATQVTNNPPLKWDELKQHLGKPVWLEIPLRYIGRWDIVRHIGSIYEGEDKDEWMWFYAEDMKSKTQYGISWQAYRKERK